MATQIDSAQLGSDHLGRIIDVGWQITTPGGGPQDVRANLGSDSQVTVDS